MATVPVAILLDQPVSLDDPCKNHRTILCSKVTLSVDEKSFWIHKPPETEAYIIII